MKTMLNSRSSYVQISVLLIVLSLIFTGGCHKIQRVNLAGMIWHHVRIFNILKYYEFDELKPESIAYFIRILNNETPMGHESEPLYMFAIDFLQHSVVLIYEFDQELFEKSRKYRAEIASIYRRWYSSNKTKIKYDEDLCVFLTGKETKEEISAYMEWCMNL